MYLDHLLNALLEYCRFIMSYRLGASYLTLTSIFDHFYFENREKCKKQIFDYDSIWWFSWGDCKLVIVVSMTDARARAAIIFFSILYLVCVCCNYDCAVIVLFPFLSFAHVCVSGQASLPHICTTCTTFSHMCNGNVYTKSISDVIHHIVLIYFSMSNFQSAVCVFCCVKF